MKMFRMNTLTNLKSKLITLQASKFSDFMKDKQTAEEKFYFDKEESKKCIIIGRLAKKLLEKFHLEEKKKLDNENPEVYQQKERLKVGIINIRNYSKNIVLSYLIS
jgi:hypothetical protein